MTKEIKKPKPLPPKKPQRNTSSIALDILRIKLLPDQPKCPLCATHLSEASISIWGHMALNPPWNLPQLKDLMKEAVGTQVWLYLGYPQPPFESHIVNRKTMFLWALNYISRSLISLLHPDFTGLAHFFVVKPIGQSRNTDCILWQHEDKNYHSKRRWFSYASFCVFKLLIHK